MSDTDMNALQRRMDGALDVLKKEFGGLRTGRASATLLAPSVTFTENILKPAFPHLSDKQFLRMMRVVVLYRWVSPRATSRS